MREKYSVGLFVWIAVGDGGMRGKMRLDKYLKVSRLIKRRTVANEACDSGRVLINDKPAKASANVKEGDIITISFGNKEVKVEVLDVQETVKKEEAKELFRYLQFTGMVGRCPAYALLVGNAEGISEEISAEGRSLWRI